MSELKTVAVVIPKPLIKEIRDLMVIEDRSFSRMVTVLLREALEERKKPWLVKPTVGKEELF